MSLAFHSGLGAAGWLYSTPNYPDYRRSAKVLHMRCFWQRHYHTTSQSSEHCSAFTETPRQEGEAKKTETLPQAARKAEISSKGRNFGSTKSPPQYEQEQWQSRESPGSSVPPYDSLSNDVNRGRLLTGTKVNMPPAHATDLSKRVIASFPAGADIRNDAPGRMLAKLRA